MSELYPSDNALLAMTTDEQTGIEFIETGKAPYYLEFRKLLWRVLANLAPIGCRVYKTDALEVGVKGGRVWINGAVATFAGSTGHALTNNDTNYVYLDTSATVQVVTDGAGWPAAEHVKLAEITTAAGEFDPTDIVDLRGYGLLHSLAGLTATVAELNKLDGASANVTAANLNALVGGGLLGTPAAGNHGHSQIQTAGGDLLGMGSGAFTDGDQLDYSTTAPSALYRLVTNGTFTHVWEHVAAGLGFNLTGDPGGFTKLRVAPHVLTYVFDGEITSNQTGKLMGIADVDGVVEDVILSVQENGSDSVDSLSVTAKVYTNGIEATQADAQITKDAAADTFHSTANPNSGSTAATISASNNAVNQGDIFTVDLTLDRTTPDTEITGVVVAVMVRPTAAQ